MRKRGKGSLIVDREPERIEIGSSLILDPAAHHVEAAGRNFWRRIARQPLANEQSDGRGKRNFIDGLRACDGIGTHAHFQRVRKICTNARHCLGAKRLDPGRLNRIEDRPSSGVARPVGGMHRIIVMSQPERHAIGKATRFRHLLTREGATGHRYAEILPALGRSISGKGKLDFGLVRHRARSAGQHGLECIEWRLFGHAGKALAAKKRRWKFRRDGLCRMDAKTRIPLQNPFPDANHLFAFGHYEPSYGKSENFPTGYLRRSTLPTGSRSRDVRHPAPDGSRGAARCLPMPAESLS